MVLCRRYHVSLIASGLPTGPCRVSNLLRFEQNKGGGGEKPRMPVEQARGRAISICSSWHAGAARPFCYISFGLWRFPRLAAQKRTKSWHSTQKCLEANFWAHFRCKHSQEQSPGADISVMVSACQCADASRKWAQSLYPWRS